MAASGERRMVFDIRGRRKHVVRVVYALLALLMGASLFLVVGPNIGGLLGTSSPTSNAASLLEEQAAGIERRLRRSPEDPSLLLSLTRTRISAGNALTEVNSTTGRSQPSPPPRATSSKKPARPGARYLKQAGKKPSPSAAQLIAGALFSLAQTSTTGPEAEANLKAAAQAQQIVADAHPSLGSVSTLAEFKYFAFDFAGGDKDVKQAQSLATSTAQKKQLETQLGEVRKRAKAFQKQVKAEAKESKGKGKEALKNPLGGLSGEGSALP